MINLINSETPLERKPEYISFDPGHSTGVAFWDKDGICFRLTEVDTAELDNILEALEKPYPKKFIYEKYTLWKERNRQGDKLITVQVIGNLRGFANRNGIHLIENQQGDRKIAALWSGMKVPKGHMPNWQSAYLHGYYHLHIIGLIPARVLEQK